MTINIVIYLSLITIAFGSLCSHEQKSTVNPKLTEPSNGVEVEWIDPPVPLVRNMRSHARGSTVTSINHKHSARPISISSANGKNKPKLTLTQNVNQVKPPSHGGSVGSKNKLNEKNPSTSSSVKSELLTIPKINNHILPHVSPGQQAPITAKKKLSDRSIRTGSNDVEKSFTNSADGKSKLPAPISDAHKGSVEVSVNKNDKSDATANLKVNQNIYTSPDGAVNLGFNGGASKSLNNKDYTANAGLNLDHSKGGSLGIGIDHNDKDGTTGSVGLKQKIYASDDGATTFNVDAVASKNFDHGTADKQLYLNLNHEW